MSNRNDTPERLAASMGILKVGELAFWQGPHGQTRMYVPDNRKTELSDRNC